VGCPIEISQRGGKRVNTSHLSQKGGKRRQESSNLADCQKATRKSKELSMYRLREMAIDDKVCEQVSMTLLSEV
jgi:hypothetical protein